MMLENMIDDLNIVLGRQKNFLRWFEVHFHSPKAVFPPTSAMRYCPEKPLLGSKNELETSVEKFSDVLEQYSSHLSCSPTSYLYAPKKWELRDASIVRKLSKSKNFGIFDFSGTYLMADVGGKNRFGGVKINFKPP